MSKSVRLFLFLFVCVTSFAYAQPANDNPCNATNLNVNASCTYTIHNNNNATNTTGVPAPGCANYSGGDVWFTVTVPASGAVTVDSKQGTMTDGGMAFYTGPSCNNLSLLACDDDNSNNGLMPLLNAAGLTPGSTLYIRFWEYGNNGNGNFHICATSGPDATNQDCPNAIPICQNTYSTIVSYAGTGSIPNEINPSNSCLMSGERNDVWYTFTVNASGILNFLITPVNMGDDYDWAVYNLTNANCTDIYSNSAIMVSCNYSADPGTTGPNGGGTTNWQNALGVRYNLTIPVTAGQTYVVNVSNYSASNDGYTIDFGASTANIFDAVAPALTSLNQPLACGATSITFNFSENIQCSSVQNGDFSLTGPGGPYTLSNWTSTGCAIGADYDNTYTVTVSPPITTTGNYTFCLTNTSGSVLDLCGNVAPASCLVFAINAMTGNVNFTNVSCNGGSNGTITITANGGTAPIQYSIDNGTTFQAGNVFNNLPAGAYNVQAKDAFGCTYLAVVNIAEPNPIVVNPVVVDAGCGLSNGSITVNVVGGTGALQYSDNGGASFQASNAFNNLGAGNYDIVVADVNGCTGTATVAINNASSPVINSTPSVDVNCNGANNGSITINASGGTGAIQYSINNGGTFQAGNTFNNLAAGNYDIVIQDGSGCQTSTTVTINEPPPIVVNSNSNNSTCGDNNGNININANGGTGALQYSIDNGATFQAGNSFNGLPAGNYNIVVEDANGCQETGNIVVADTPGPTVTTTPSTDASCNGGFDGTIVINSNGGTAPIQYSVDNGSTFQPAGNFNALPAGNYSIVIMDANGCQATANAVINEPPALVLNTNPSDANCNGSADGSIQVNANGGTGAIQYSIDNGSTWQGGNTFNGLAAGNYDVTIRDANGCQATVNIDINEPPALALNANTVDANCNGGNDGSIAVNANGGTGAIQYSVDNGATWQAGSSFNGLPAGNYTVTIEDANGCQATTNVVINEPTPVVFNTNISDGSCGNSNGSVTVNGNGGTGSLEYSIDGGATFQNGNTFNGLAAGNYNVVVQDANGCQATAAIVVNDQPSPTIAATPVTDVSCNAGSDGTIQVNSNGGTGAIQYSIDNGATFQGGNTFNGLPAGNYSIVIQDANGCQATVNVSIAEPPALVLNSNATTSTCGNSNGSIDITANGGTGAIQYSIDNGATFQASNIFNNLPAGNYDLVIQDANGCVTNGTINVPDAPAPTIAATPSTDATCNGGSDGSFSVNANGGTGAIQYSIDNGATWQAGNSFNGLTAGNYSVTIQDDNGCQATTNVVINEPSPVLFNTNISDGSCGLSNGSVTINGNGGTGSLEYSIDGGATFQNGNTFNGLAAGNYNITVQDANGCQASGAIVVNDQPSPTIGATPSADASCNGGSDGTITINSNGGTGAIQYSIDNGATFQAGNIFNNLPAGNYQVMIQDANGCTDTKNVNISEPPALVLNSNATTSTCGSNNGSIDITANGGTGAIQYSIDNGTSFQSGNIFNNLLAGNYDIVIQDANGCTAAGNINVPDAPAPVISGTPTVDATCNGGSDGSFSVNANGGTGVIQYSIDNGATWQAGNSFNGLTAGNYTITIQDANGCQATANLNIGEPAPVIVNTNTVTATCGNSDGSITINANGGTGAYQYSIDNGATFQNGNNFINLPSGNYDIVVQDANGCQGVDVASVSNASAPVISSAPVTDANCNGDANGSIIVNANGGTGALQFSIDNGATWQAGNNFNGLPAGMYSIVVQDVNGCQANTSATINEPAALVLNSNTTTATCGNNNGSIDITANGGSGTLQYSIDNGTTFQNGNVFNNLSPGNYDLVIQDANGCTLNGGAIVNSAPSPVISATPKVNVTCNGGTNGSITINSTGGTGVIQYSIDNGATYQAGNIFSNLPAGNYLVMIQDANGCTDTKNVNISEPAAIVFNTASTNASCGNSDGTLTINANGGTGTLQYSIDNGATFQNGNNFTNLLAATYNIVIQDANGCLSSGTGTVNNAAAPAISTTPVVDVTCNGGNDGSVIVNANGGTGALQYSIDNGNTFQPGNNFNGLLAGNYNIVVQDVNGCEATASISINEPLPVIFNSNPVTATCGNNNGSLVINGNGGTGALQYSINNGSTFQASGTFNNLASGNYDIVVQDANGCTAAGTAFVNNAASPTIALVNTNDLTCNGSGDGSITITSNGGTGAIQYSIDNGTTFQPSGAFNNLPAGNYSILIQDVNGCTDASNVNLAQPTAVVYNAAIVQPICGNSNGSISLNANGGSGNYEFSIDSGATFQQGNIFNGLPAGNYNVVIQDGAGCTASGIVAVTNASSPVINNLNIGDASCYGLTDGSISISANGGVGGLQYSIDNAVTFQNGNNFPNLPAGTYNIVVQDGNGCSVSSVANILQPAEITFNTATVNSTCGNATGSLTITAQGGTGTLQYSIDNGTTFQAGNVFNNLAATNYDIIVRDATGCQAVGIASINNNNGPVVTGTVVNDLTCFGSNNGSILINANGGTGVLQYSINNGTTYQPGNSFINLPGGAYSIVVLDGNNCIATSNVIVNEPPQIVFNAVVSNETCTDGNGSINVIANGGTGALQYSNNNGTNFQNGALFNNLPGGNYTIVVQDANNCTATAISIVNDEAAPVIVSTNAADVTCNGSTDGSIIVTANGGTGTIQYSIDNGTTLFPNNTFNNLASGIYNIMIQDANGCTATIIDTVIEPAAIVFNSNTTTATCSNSNGSIVINANGGIGTLQYSIDNGTTFQSTNTFSGVGTGNYDIVVQDANGCSASGTAFVNNAAPPTITAAPVTNVSCNGGSNGSLTITANGGTGVIQYSIDNGTTFQNGNIFNGLPAGTYQVIIQDANNCTTTAVANIIEPTAITGNTISATASCGNSDGSLQVNANGGTGVYQYSINGGSSYQASNTFNNLLAGNYNIIIKDANGCTKAITGSVSNTSAPVVASVPVINVSCNGGSNGTITINSNGGTGAVEYSIDNGNNFQSGNIFTGLPAGTYNIVVQDALGCLGSASINVNEPPALVFNSNATIATCGNNNAAISIQANGGTGAITYSIDSGSTFHNSGMFNNLAPGTYYVVVHDANNCTTTGSVNVNAAPSPVINAANAVNITCHGYNNGSITINATGGSGALSYSINNGTTYQATNTFTNLTPGNYSILVQDTNGCTDAAAAIIVQPAAIALNTNTANVNCFGGSDGSATVHATGGTAPFTYSWSSGGNDSTASALSSGSYTVTVTDDNNCTASISVNINQPAALALTYSSANVKCNGGNSGSASVTPSGGTLPYSYLWSNGATTHNITGINSGNYSVVVTDAHACTIVQSFVITQPVALTSAISANPVSCFGFNNGSMTVTPAGGVTPYSYQWSPVGGTAATASNLIAGTYTVVITDSNGCSITKTDSVTSPAALAASTNISNVTCHGSSNGSLVASATGGTTPYSYLWSMGATTASIGNLPGGTYTVTVTDNNNCVTQKASVIYEPAVLVLNVSNAATICIGQASIISASAAGGTTPYSFIWNNGTTTNSQSVSPVVTTTYSVNITDANGCTAAQQSVTITVNPPLAVVASGANAICEEQSAVISAVASGGNGGPYTYSWSNNANTSSTTVTPAQTTTYTVSVSDNCGTPPAMANVTIIVNPLPDVAFTPIPVSGCIPVDVKFSDNSITPSNSTYSWTFGDGQISNEANPDHTYTEPGTYSIQLTVTTPQGCVSSLKLPDAVNAYPLPEAAFTTDKQTASILQPEINFTDNSIGADYWNWDFGDNFGTSAERNVLYVYRDTGAYRITLIAENIYGCLDTSYGEVIIEGAYTIYIPNAFSPNNDGKNDFFTVYGGGIQKLDMFIYNRWGERMFHSDNINRSWNGSSELNNSSCKEDVYVYLVKVTDMYGKKHELSGSVTLVR